MYSQHTSPISTRSQSDRVRLEWIKFEVWLESEHKQLDIQRGAALREIKLRLDSSRRDPTLTRGYEEEKEKLLDPMHDLETLSLRFQAEWHRRLAKSGLKAEDWWPMTPDEQKAVRAAFDVDASKEKQGSLNNTKSAESSALFSSNLDVHRRNTRPEAPSFDRWTPEEKRRTSLSPLPDISVGYRAPPEISARGRDALFQLSPERRPLGTRYIGPALFDEETEENILEADFAQWKKSLREEMIRNFHEEAMAQEIMLVRNEYEVKLEEEAVKALLVAHEANMLELRQKVDGERKEIINVERVKRLAEIERRTIERKRQDGSGPTNQFDTRASRSPWVQSKTSPELGVKIPHNARSADETVGKTDKRVEKDVMTSGGSVSPRLRTTPSDQETGSPSRDQRMRMSPTKGYRPVTPTHSPGIMKIPSPPNTKKATAQISWAGESGSWDGQETKSESVRQVASQVASTRGLPQRSRLPESARVREEKFSTWQPSAKYGGKSQRDL